ncbi:MAG TPA: HAMP domain-containing protein [Euzebyales bacterium]
MNTTETTGVVDEPSSDRRPSLRRRLAVVLVGMSLLSVLVLGAYNFLVARSLLSDAVERQLENHQAGQVRALVNGLDRISQAVGLLARAGATVEALTTMGDGFRELEREARPLSARQLDELERVYVDSLASTAITSPPDVLVPDDPATRHVQYHYLAANPFPADERHQLAEAPGDTTAYGRAHAASHRQLVELRDGFGLGDILLVDAQGTVVYSTDKRIDLGTDALVGPLRHPGLRDVVEQRLSQVGVSETVFVDFRPYLPASGQPVMLAAATVSDGTEIIGAVVAEVPAPALNALTTFDGQWRASGLGATGESYVVGADRLMRSDARLWLEDPDAYLAALDDAGYAPDLSDAIAAAGTTVLQQPVRTASVDAAFDREPFSGRAGDYLDRPALTVSGLLPSNDLDWVVVSQLLTAEANEPLGDFNRLLLVTALMLVPLVAVAGLFLADRITRPVTPVVETATAVAGGDLSARAPELGRHEIGDVGRRLNALTAELAEQRAARTAEEHEITQLLQSILPARLVDELRVGHVAATDLADTATVIALTVHGPLERHDLAPEEALQASARLSQILEDTATRLDIERVRSASEHHLFAAGLGAPDVAADVAATFVTDVGVSFDTFTDETGIDVDYHAGLAAGDVVAGLVHPNTFTYSVFGEPARTALAIDAVATDGQILIHRSAADRLRDDWDLAPADGLVDLRGEPVDATMLVTRQPAASPDDR